MLCLEGVISDGEEVASVPVLEIEEGALPVALEVVALEVVDQIYPLAVEGNLALGIYLAGMGHPAGHGALDLIDNEVGLKLLLGLWLADGHQFVDKAIDEDGVLG